MLSVQETLSWAYRKISKLHVLEEEILITLLVLEALSWSYGSEGSPCYITGST